MQGAIFCELNFHFPPYTRQVKDGEVKSRLGPGSLSSEAWKNKPCVLDSLRGARRSDPKLSYLPNMSVCLDMPFFQAPGENDLSRVGWRTPWWC